MSCHVMQHSNVRCHCQVTEMQETAWAAVVVRKVRKGLDTVAQELRNMPNRSVLLRWPMYCFYKCDVY
jgi:hypothetical protein